VSNKIRSSKGIMIGDQVIVPDFIRIGVCISISHKMSYRNSQKTMCVVKML